MHTERGLAVPSGTNNILERSHEKLGCFFCTYQERSQVTGGGDATWIVKPKVEHLTERNTGRESPCESTRYFYPKAFLDYSRRDLRIGVLATAIVLTISHRQSITEKVAENVMSGIHFVLILDKPLPHRCKVFGYMRAKAVGTWLGTA